MNISESACAEVEVSLLTDPEVSQEAIDTARKIGIKFQEDAINPKVFMADLLKQLLLQREKLDQGLLNDYLGAETAKWWKTFLSSLEDGKRRLLDVNCGSVVFTLFCPTKKSFSEIEKKKWGTKPKKLLQSLGKYQFLLLLLLLLFEKFLQL